jgi:broad specificity phosphatase PhoE
MGRLFLVRHAQASFLSSNYDQLSELGETQARLLGKYWARRNLTFNRICVGPAIRHRRTVQLVGDAYCKAGVPFVDPVVTPEFDEFQGDAVLAQSLPQLLAQNDKIREWHEAMQCAGTESQKRANFQRVFETAISLWANGGISLPNVESWTEFCARVNRGLTNFVSSAQKGETAAIFTSGGPIAAVVRRALRLSASDTLQIAWMSRNCAFSEFLFSRERLTLSSFNSHPHLDEDSLLTYR